MGPFGLREEDQGQKWEAFGPRGRYKGSVMGEKGVRAPERERRCWQPAAREGRGGFQGGRGEPDLKAVAILRKVQPWLNRTGRERGGC